MLGAIILYMIGVIQLLQFKVDSERQNFEKLFIYSQSFCQKSVEEAAEKNIVFIFHFVRDV